MKTSLPCDHWSHTKPVVKNNKIEPRFGYVYCEDHAKTPPASEPGWRQGKERLHNDS